MKGISCRQLQISVGKNCSDHAEGRRLSMEQALDKQKFSAGHLVQFYKESQYLSESVAEYIRIGLAKGDGIFILATRAHWQELISSLLQSDPLVERHMADQRLIFIDARTALQQIIHD